jgi:hypothetical protein
VFLLLRQFLSTAQATMFAGKGTGGITKVHYSTSLSLLTLHYTLYCYAATVLVHKVLQLQTIMGNLVSLVRCVLWHVRVVVSMLLSKCTAAVHCILLQLPATCSYVTASVAVLRNATHYALT